MSSATTSTPPPRVRKAIIPICDHTTSLYPSTKSTPKSLLPLIDLDGVCRPIIHILIEEVLLALEWKESEPLKDDIHIGIVVNSLEQQMEIEKYFSPETDSVLKENKKLQPITKRLATVGLLLEFFVQEEPLGLGHAILLCKEWCGNDPFLVVHDDAVYISSHSKHATVNCARQLVDCYTHFGTNNAGTMCLSLNEIEVEDFESSIVVTGLPVTGVDLYASHTEQQRQIDAYNAKHGLNFAAMQLESEGVSRFTRSPMSPSPLDQQQQALQGEIYRVNQVVPFPSESKATELKVPRPGVTAATPAYSYPDYAATRGMPTMAAPTHAYLATAGIDLLGPEIFPILEKLLTEMEASKEATPTESTAATSSSTTVPAAATSPPPPKLTQVSFPTALQRLIASSSTPLIGLKLLGQRFPLNTPFAYAKTMAAFAHEAEERAQTKEDAGMLNAGEPTKPTTTQPPPQTAVKLSNAALPKRATYD